MKFRWVRRFGSALLVISALGGCAAQSPPMSGHSGVHLYGEIDEGVLIHP
ncbi:hypothetical protein Ga0061069_105175 [Thiomonas bhubaneswarensis]|uniref:Lipoprotein n=1 Tax=Thiomonas bhubaneswarensis TaxID=339866 RepID=A0A0K6I254_9BURK|nr:hypothetical protein Ga0061069_105175 [Thiomonas bhubaneswarensis]